MKHSYVSGTVVFTDSNANARTNESFRAKTEPEHHKGETPLTDLPIDMVLDVPVGDELHLLHLGLMTFFLNGWKTGAFGMRTKWSSLNEREISEYLVSCNEFKPSEIHRQMRPLSEMPRWKATEYRTFLLYTSLTVLKKFLPDKHFKHYLLFFCSIVILGSEYHCDKLIDTADEMIKTFLNLFKSIYGIHHFTMNLHNLSHLVDEVRRFGVLGKFNAYSFENKLQVIKRLVRSGNLPLNQIAKRILETKCGKIPKNSDAAVKLCKKIPFHCVNFKRIGFKYTVFSELKTNDFKIGNTTNNQWILTRNFNIICVKYFDLYENKRCYFYGREIQEKNSYFETPFESDVLLIYGAKKRFRSPKLYGIEQIACKLFCLPYFGSFNESEQEEEFPPFDYVFIPVWHTLK